MANRKHLLTLNLGGLQIPGPPLPPQIHPPDPRQSHPPDLRLTDLSLPSDLPHDRFHVRSARLAR